LDDITEDIFPSVEDLLLNMSVNNTADYDVDSYSKGQYNIKAAAQTAYISPSACADETSRRDAPQAYKSRDWLMQLDGLSPKAQVDKKSAKEFGLQPSSNLATEIVRQPRKTGGAFSVYHKMAGEAEEKSSIVDDYETLPWHLNRRNSKVVTRVKQRKNSGN